MPWPSRWGVLPRPKGDGVSADIVLFIDPPFLVLYPRAPPPEEVPIPWFAQACRPEAALLAPRPWLRTEQWWTLATDPHAIPAPFRRPEEAPLRRAWLARAAPPAARYAPAARHVPPACF